MKGFTDKIIEIIGDYLHYDSGNYKSYEIPSSFLIKISKMIPENMLSWRQNSSPKFLDFIKIAKKCDRCKFIIYVITKERQDERVTVEGVYIPKDKTNLILSIIESADAKPDESSTEGNYRRLWWD